MYWLSFCDPDRPAGPEFLGVCIIAVDDFLSAVRYAHCLNCNPGGEVFGELLDDGVEVPRQYVHRLLTDGQVIADLRQRIGVEQDVP